MTTPEEAAADWFTLPPQYRTKEKLLEMVRAAAFPMTSPQSMLTMATLNEIQWVLDSYGNDDVMPIAAWRVRQLLNAARAHLWAGGWREIETNWLARRENILAELRKFGRYYLPRHPHESIFWAAADYIEYLENRRPPPTPSVEEQTYTFGSQSIGLPGAERDACEEIARAALEQSE